MPPASTLVHTEVLSRRYKRGSEIIDAVVDVTLDIERGGFAVIMGPSGCGKSTLLNLIGGIERPTSGRVSVDGLALEHASEAELTGFRRSHVGFIFQFYNLLPFITAEENVALPLQANGTSRAVALRLARERLDQVGLSLRRTHKPAELSGGEQKRVAIACAIIAQPPLILADEPTGDLDATGTQAVISMLRNLAGRAGHTVVMATHNERVVLPGDQLICMVNGRLELT